MMMTDYAGRQTSVICCHGHRGGNGFGNIFILLRVMLWAGGSRPRAFVDNV